MDQSVKVRRAAKSLNAQVVMIFMVEQHANLALQIADYGYVLQTGRKILAGTAQDLLCNPQIRDAYLGGEPAELVTRRSA